MFTSTLSSTTTLSSRLIDTTPIPSFLFGDNTLARANQLGSLSSTVSRSGFVGNSDTVDYYQVDLTGDRLNVSLTGMTADADLRLIRDYNGNGLVDTGDTIAEGRRGSNFDESINLSDLATGTYFIQVSQFSGDTHYSLKLSSDYVNNLLATEVNVGTLTNLQSFNNPSFSEGESYDRRNGIQVTDTSDIYQFNLSSIRNVSLSISGLSSDLDLRLIRDINSNGLVESDEVLATSNYSGTWNEAINKNLEAGDYFVQIYRFNGSSNYSLNLSSDVPQVQLNVNVVNAIDNPDTGWFGDHADYYSRISIDGASWTSPVVSNNNNIAPNWRFTQGVNSRYVSIEVQLWDSDGGLAGADDQIDIDAGSGLRNVNITYDLITGAVSGDVAGWGGSLIWATGGGGDGDRASLGFTVNSGDWYTLNLKDNDLQKMTRSFAADYNLSRQDMIALMRDCKDYGIIDTNEFNDLQTITTSLSYMMPDYVRVLSNKILNGDTANIVSGIGNLLDNATSTRMESLIGKWFLGNDRPDTTHTYRNVSGNLFQGGISYLDVDQNALGDCYFLAALGATALQRSTTIQNMFVSSNDDNNDGVTDSWTVRMFNNGVADYVTVDRFMPTYSWGGAVYAGWGGGSNTDVNNELWVALAEKAYAQFNESGWLRQDNTNSYAGIEGGWPEYALEQITGLNADGHTTVSHFLWWETSNTLNEMISAFNNSQLVTLCTSSPSSSLIVGSHCYTLVSYDAVNDRFQVYNPWKSDGGSAVDGLDDGLRWVSRQEMKDNFSSWAALA